MSIFSWLTSKKELKSEKEEEKLNINNKWKDVTLEELEQIHDKEPDNVLYGELWDFTGKDVENMKVWEEKYFIFYERKPLLLKRIKKSIPYIEEDFEILSYFEWINNPERFWNIPTIIEQPRDVRQVTKKYFFKRVLYWMYEVQYKEALFSKNRTHETLIELERLTEKKRYLYMPLDIKKNELEGHTVEELEEIINIEEVKTKGVIRKDFRHSDFEDMKVWETWYFQDDGSSFLVRRTKKTLPKYADNDFETLEYNLWINNPFFRLWLWLMWRRKEVWYVSQMYFYMFVLYNEYQYRMSMLSRLTNKTQEELEKIEEYKRKMDLYYFRDYY